MVREFECVYQDSRHQRFFILASLDDLALHFCHWRELQRFGLSSISAGQRLRMDAAEPDGLFESRGLRVTSAPEMLGSGPDTTLSIVSGEDFTGSGLANLVSLLEDSVAPPLVMIGCRIGSLEWRDQHVRRGLAFLDCTFEGNARFIGCRFDRTLWLCNSVFRKHFSLKSSIVEGDLHLESCDFSGEGGLSCRGLQARNCYLDLGVKGSSDITWLNEMQIEGMLSLGGSFSAPVQLMNDQDPLAPAEHRRQVGAIEFGREIYVNEHANATRFEAAVVIEGYALGRLNAHRVEFESLAIRDLHCDAAELHRVKVSGDLEIENTRFAAGGLKLEQSSVLGHLRLERVELEGTLSLRDSSVSENAYLDAPRFHDRSRLDLHRFSCARFLLSPPRLLLNGSRFRLFSARRFDLLRAQDDVEQLGDQYCSLKHWLADAGQLDLEDTAFFCMRDCHSRHPLSRFVFGRVFGWGVRLTNIAASALVLILAYALLYFLLSPDLGWLGALVLSKQAFIGAFFGTVEGLEPGHLLAVVVTTEALLGVLFVTVFVGAYIRKLLR